GGAEVGLHEDEYDGRADDQADAQKRAEIEVGAVVRVEEFCQHQRSEDLRELRRLELKAADVNPAAHVRGQSAEDNEIAEQGQPDAVEDRRDVEEDVIVDD